MTVAMLITLCIALAVLEAVIATRRARRAARELLWRDDERRRAADRMEDAAAEAWGARVREW